MEWLTDAETETKFWSLEDDRQQCIMYLSRMRCRWYRWYRLNYICDIFDINYTDDIDIVWVKQKISMIYFVFIKIWKIECETKQEPKKSGRIFQ